MLVTINTIKGWGMFIVCALLYTAAGFRDGDILTFLGSMVFLAACVVFLIPLLRR